MARARSRLIARPSPTPECARVCPSSTCTNGSKIASSRSAGMPTPESTTRIVARSPSPDASTRMRAAVAGELDRVADEVDENLFEPMPIGAHRYRVRREAAATARCASCPPAARRAAPTPRRPRQRHELHLHAHTTRLEAREVEDVVDQAREVRLTALHAPENLGLLFVDGTIESRSNELRESERRLQRRAQLVTHRREECGLGAVRRFRRGARAALGLEETSALERLAGNARQRGHERAIDGSRARERAETEW